MAEKKVVIIGAGPTGLGAAYKLNEIGHKDWEVYEKNSYVGGLSASFKDEKGFWWDVGGHVLFSHYPYFDEAVRKVLKDEYLTHLRESWIWILNRFVPYPFQNNIHRLPKKQMLECLNGLKEVRGKKIDPSNFEKWVYSIFGNGIAKYFMIPYNWKVWAYNAKEMSSKWIGERVSVVDIARIEKNIAENKDDVSWGPNNKFLFPLHGATGSIFRNIADLFKDKIKLNKELDKIDLEKKIITFKDGTETRYDHLISTMPIDLLVKKARLKEYYKYLKDLKHSNSLIVGMGVKGKSPTSKCWMYFPESNSPCYRVTCFSNYSPNNVPGKDYYSLMAETSYSEEKKEDKKTIIERTIKAFLDTKQIPKGDKKNIAAKYLIDMEYTYPIPTVDRDAALRAIQLYLMKKNVFSRGRFGAWKYEIGNMDHSFMQGAEAVDKILNGKEETTWTI
jgi:protoporphyrinogen oxidase